jgi:8-amino-7-oxononanoate synthase
VRRGPLRHVADDLADLDRRGLLRERPVAIDQLAATTIPLCSNDYLGYRSTGRLKGFGRAALEEHPIGAGASRLVCGEHAAHLALEGAIASWLGTDESIVFTSGYAANVGLMSALGDEGDLIVSDALNHASIIDGCRLSRAQVVVVDHLDAEGVRRALRASNARGRWVVTEGYFSMDGDSPDFGALRSICDEFEAGLVVDEAHAIGVFGPEGRGRAAEAGIKPDVVVGTLGKALGAQGAFVTGSSHLCRWLWNRARSFVFSTGLSPMLAAIGLGAVGEARSDDEGRRRLCVITARLRAGLAERGLAVASPLGPVLPVITKSEVRALAWARALGKKGVVVQAIRPPTVPNGTSRLRITARADLTEGELERALAAFGRVARDLEG